MVRSTRLVSLLGGAIALGGWRGVVLRLLLLVFASFFFDKRKGVSAAFFGVVVEKAVWEF